MDLTPHTLGRQLARLPAARRYRVAYSGGRDSHVLLHCLRQLAPALELCAIHVHHGLHRQADRWAAHCVAVCADLGVPLQVVEVNAHPGPGESPEAAARDARYRALAACLERGEALVTAHHREDQAETVLLQLLRGAGPHGLAAMPAQGSLGPGLHLRPLLAFARQALADYAARNQLRWVEDHSNRDLALDRNYLRLRVAPLLAERWPSWDATLARAASNQADMARLADELGRLDLAATADADGLALEPLRRLSVQRQANLLRLWLRQQGLPMPSRAQLQRVLEDVIRARGDAEPVVHWEGAEVRRYRDRLLAMPPLSGHDPTQRIPWRLQEPLLLPDLGLRLCAQTVQGRGVRVDAVRDGRAEVRFRRGGEQLRPAGGAHRRELKTLLQEGGVAPWQRGRIPLLYVGDQLAAVGDLWVEHALAAGPGQWGYELSLTALDGAHSH